MIKICNSHFANKTTQLPFISALNSAWIYSFSRDFKLVTYPLNHWFYREMCSDVPIQRGTYF